MSEIIICATVAVGPNERVEFERQAAQLTAMVAERERGRTLTYRCDWAAAVDGRACITEIYADWDALRAHSANVMAATANFHALFELTELLIIGAAPPTYIVEKYSARYGSRVCFFDQPL